MYNKLRLGAATINTTPLDWDGNLEKILNCIKVAKEKNVGILCLPELCITGYGCEDMFLSTDTTDKAMEVLVKKILPETGDIFVSVGLPVNHKGSVYNCVASLFHGEILGFNAKQHLAGDGIHYEPRWFKPWKNGVKDTISIVFPTHEPMYSSKPHSKIAEAPIGDLHFVIPGEKELRIGYEICEDAWVSNRPGQYLSRQSVDIILNPSASHFAFGKSDIRERFVIEGSRAFNCAYVYANLNGNEAGRIVYDGGALIAATGDLLARGERFSWEETTITTGVVDLALIKTRQAASASREIDTEKSELAIKANNGTICMGVPYIKITSEDNKINKPYWEENFRKEEEFTRSIALGLQDYMEKSKTKGFVVSLSGGADSAAVVCLIHYMALLSKTSSRKIKSINNILTTVYQATENSSETTKDAARTIAEFVNAKHHEVNVDNLVKEYTRIFEEATLTKLNWDNDDILLQNIQARVRGPMAWMFANKENKLLLSTSNRSEAAVGYATMDGDTCGSLSPIAGIDKAFLLNWIRWTFEHGVNGENKIPALDKIIKQQPTAELRPFSEGEAQTDEKDLMPYPILDEIEKLAIRDKMYPERVLEGLLENPKNQTVNKKILVEWVKKFFTLWCRNQWKRERFCPAIHVDDKNLDPRSWCRFPILSGGFKKELEEIGEKFKDRSEKNL